MKNKTPEFERQCRLCEAASPLRDAEFVLCEKKGIVRALYCCRAFRYDPLKRDPGTFPPPPKLEYVPLEDDDTAAEAEKQAT